MVIFLTGWRSERGLIYCVEWCFIFSNVRLKTLSSKLYSLYENRTKKTKKSYRAVHGKDKKVHPNETRILDERHFFLNVKKKQDLSWILQPSETCTREWGLSSRTSTWRFEWLCRDAFLSPVCCCRLVNRSGDVCDRDRWLNRKKNNTHSYNIVENEIRLLWFPLPLLPLMVPVCPPLARVPIVVF